MTNFELLQKLLEHGAELHSFVIVSGDHEDFIEKGFSFIYGSYPVWTDYSLNNFIRHLNNTIGINYIYNGGHDYFNEYGGFLKSYEVRTLTAKRQRKIGKINYEIFKQRIADSL